jgi:hypothetical protein
LTLPSPSGRIAAMLTRIDHVMIGVPSQQGTMPGGGAGNLS